MAKCHLVPQLCVCEDEAKEDEVSKKGDDADDQDGQPNPRVKLGRQNRCHKFETDLNGK